MRIPPLKIKVCGLKYPDNVDAISALDVDFVGFIFYPKSKRFVENVPELNAQTKALKVGVFVNETPEDVLETCSKFRLDIAQLHGDEYPDECELIRRHVQVIKNMPISNATDFDECVKFEKCVDYFLFDTKTASYGGSGRKFDWEVLKNYQKDVPFLLSGGIGPDDVENILAIEHPKLMGIDINSGFEMEPGLKNVAMVGEFVRRIKGLN